MTGGEVEQTVREVAARLGVADFVYLPTLVSKAQSNREVSDGLLLCRQGGAVIEVKTRDPQAASGDSAEAAARWLRKRYDDAIRQARGTKRTIAQRRQRNDPVRAVWCARWTSRRNAATSSRCRSTRTPRRGRSSSCSTTPAQPA